MNRVWGRRVIGWVGNGLGLLGIVFVVVKLIENAAEVNFPEPDAGFVTAVIALIGAYSVANILLAIAWRELLKQQNVIADLKWSVRVFGMSQLAKYIPGNFFHLASRQSLGVSAGLPQWAMLKAMLYEVTLITAAGILFLPLSLQYFVSGSSQLVSFSIFLLICCLAFHVVSTWMGRHHARALFLYVVLLSITGLVFFAILATFSVSFAGFPSISYVSGAYVIAWLAGFLMLGAPAGMGVRELVLFFLLESQVREGELLMAIVLSRMITSVSDLLYYLAALSMPSLR